MKTAERILAEETLVDLFCYRNALRRLLGGKYRSTISEVQRFVKGYMAAHHVSAIEAGLAMVKEALADNRDRVGACLMAAAVELAGGHDFTEARCEAE